MAQKTDETGKEASRPDATYFVELKKHIQQLTEEVERCSLCADSSRQAQAVKQQVATLLVALKERRLLPYDTNLRSNIQLALASIAAASDETVVHRNADWYDAPALLRPQDIRECHACGTQDLVTRMTPVIRHPSGTRGYACARCAPALSNNLWYL